jgi:hypothetical protein
MKPIGALTLSSAMFVLMNSCTADSFSLVTNAFGTDNFSGDPYPIIASTNTGALLLGFSENGSDGPTGLAMLDILAPISILDTELNATARRTIKATLFGQRRTGELNVPRAQFSALMTEFHPCPNDCQVGTSAAPAAISAIIGADTLSGDAIRLRFADSTLFVLPSIAPDDNAEASKLCNAVFPGPFRGGGTVVIGNTEVPFSGRRFAINACAGPDVKATTAAARGTDLLLIASTGVGPSLLGESAYQRYINGHPGTASLSSLATASVWLPSGLITGRVATLQSLTLAANSSAGRGACREAYAHHLLFDQPTFCTPEDDCPCDIADPTSCGVPAMIELQPTQGLTFLIVPDQEPTLQGLRTELRPDQAEVDGILGTQAMASAEIDIDFPNNRVLARCVDQSCRIRPTLEAATNQARDAISACIVP